ncbi:MAG TPA: DNA-processing protein DprA [Candidatus Paceibacterota bacterium]|nr:DNA-processing protein DprA [Candidatus Paceibacterota bacterium]
MDPLHAITQLSKDNYHFLLKQLDKIPDSMEMIGAMPPETYRYLCVVGSRHNSSYGKEACEKLISGLAGYPIVIVSGLAIGIDSIAHEAALKAGLRTIAFPGSGLDISVLYPAQNIGLARRIVEAGGALLSPFPRHQEGVYWAFPVRNKLMAGISNAVLLIEGAEGSGSLLTAVDAGEFGRDLLTVPGSIFSPLSYGPHMHLREAAIAVTCSEHILEALGLVKEDSTRTQYMTNQNLFGQSFSPDEKLILEKIKTPIERDELIRSLDMPAGFVNALLIELELKGIISERQGLLMVN